MAWDMNPANGGVGSDHPEKATAAWGEEMLRTVADYIVDFIEEFRKVALPAR